VPDSLESDSYHAARGRPDVSVGTEASRAYAGPVSGAKTEVVARLFADSSRIAMLEVLLDGREHSLGALADAAGVAASTATEHLAGLEQGGLVASRRDGRRRLVRLAGPDVADALESLAKLSRDGHVSGLRAWSRQEQLREARTCYDHLAGRLGVAIADAAVAEGAVTDDFSLGPRAVSWFARLGVDLATVPCGRRPLVRACTDWTERREHLAGALGAAICMHVLEAGWALRRPSSRALRVTPLGEMKLRELGCDLS
jgi:DNA-binding transcriptional ArsR family regulator